MTCPACGRYGAADEETGYDVDEICPACQQAGWSEMADGSLINVHDERSLKAVNAVLDLVEKGRSDAA